jgi:hypothetical protein
MVGIAAWSGPVDCFPADFGKRSAGREPLDQVGIGDVGSSERDQVRKRLCDRRADSPRRSGNERDLSLKLLHGADPPWLLDDCVSQGPDPVFKPLCLHHHHLAVVGAERNSRHTLKGGEEMDREFS